jgi:hypothetical protein
VCCVGEKSGKGQLEKIGKGDKEGCSSGVKEEGGWARVVLSLVNLVWWYQVVWWLFVMRINSYNVRELGGFEKTREV